MGNQDQAARPRTSRRTDLLQLRVDRRELTDIVPGLERAVVTGVVGVHSGASPISGRFVVGISDILIENVDLASPDRAVPLASDIIKPRLLGRPGRQRPQGHHRRHLHPVGGPRADGHRGHLILCVRGRIGPATTSIRPKGAP